MRWGTLLFPRSLAEVAYVQAARHSAVAGEVRELQRLADAHSISLFSVFREVNNYAKAQGLAPLRCRETDIHAIRNSQRGKLVSESLFEPTPPEPAAYIAAAQNQFRSAFFAALQRMVRARAPVRAMSSRSWTSQCRTLRRSTGNLAVDAGFA